MPRAWPVEIHARCYTDYPTAACDATGLARGDSRSLLHRLSNRSLRCHGLGPWRFTLVATPTIHPQLAMPRAWPVEIHARCYTDYPTAACDATGLARGDSRSLLSSRKRETPRPKAVASEHVRL